MGVGASLKETTKEMVAPQPVPAPVAPGVQSKVCMCMQLAISLIQVSYGCSDVVVTLWKFPVE
jgi:hypothetical protein